MKNDNETLVMVEDDGTVDPRPRRNPDKRIRGYLSTFEKEGAYYFDATKPKPEMKQEVIFEKGNVKVFKTGGEKENSFILKAKVSGEVPNPIDALMDKAGKELKSQLKKEPQVLAKTFLYDEKGKLQVWHRRKEKQLCAFITLDTSISKELIFNELARLMCEVNKVIYGNKF